MVLGVSPERFSRMPQGVTRHWDDHGMPEDAPWDATCHWGLLGGWNVAVFGLLRTTPFPSIGANLASHHGVLETRHTGKWDTISRALPHRPSRMCTQYLNSGSVAL